MSFCWLFPAKKGVLLRQKLFGLQRLATAFPLFQLRSVNR